MSEKDIKTKPQTTTKSVKNAPKSVEHSAKQAVKDIKTVARDTLVKNAIDMNYSQVSRHKKAFFRGAGYFVYSQYKASASFGVSILSVPCGLFVL